MFERGDLVWYFGEKKTVTTVGIFGVYFSDGVFATHCMVKPIYRNGKKVKV